MRFERGHSQRLAPVGRCIYCGVTQEPLHEEHIVPLGLGGCRILPHASCVAHERITGRLEGYCLQATFGDIRVSADFPTRNKNRRAEKIEVPVSYEDGTKGTISISPDEYPEMLSFPRFPPAMALRGLEDDPTASVQGGGWWTWYNENKLKEFAVKHSVQRVLGPPIDPTKFARMIAKIAHCHAVGVLGVDGFTPLAVDFILAGNSNMNYLVGGQSPEPPPDDSFYKVDLYKHLEYGMVGVQVRLFADIGAPRYNVLVGLLPGGKIAKTF